MTEPPDQPEPQPTASPVPARGAGGRDRPYVVGIGASAGGLEAFEQFFSRLPPNADLAILHGRLHVLQPVAPRGMRTPIDSFFRRLAEDQKEKAVAIILSGMGSDGTLGVRAIKEHLGMVMAQDPASAKYDAMPRNAIQTTLVDYVAPAEELPAKLIQYVDHLSPPLGDRQPPDNESSTALEKVFVLLRTRSGNDFSCYKTSTVNRRIERRMGIHQFNSLSRYVRFLRENPQEVELLCNEMLIGVTGFFRDPGLFDALNERVIPQWLQGRPPGPLRVWNPGCSTGEETYSLAILLTECLQRLQLDEMPTIQVFATDIDPAAIDKARRGVFPPGIAADVSPQRLQRFFVQEGENYRVKKDIRDAVVFASQNLLADPPFTKIDILCCRNVLIYLNGETQKKLLPLMHYALNPHGLLILGTAESNSGFGHLFSSLDAKWKIFRRREVPVRPDIHMPAYPSPQGPRIETTEKAGALEMDVLYAAQRALLDLYGPPSVVINAEGDILYVNSRTGKYLEPASGKVNMNVFAMAREGLREDLGVAIHNAATRKSACTMKGLKVKSNGGSTTIDITVSPLAERNVPGGLLLVVFEENRLGDPGEAAPRGSAPEEPATPAGELEEELRRTRERLQFTIQEMQATQEELRSANEELQSSNEELQSSNEELNSSKEEMQSLNEEMQTVNAELQTKMEELSESNSDMKNLLNGIEIATVILDNQLAVKRFTPEAAKIVNLAPTDVGRPLGHFTTHLKYDRL
ncbi:MAG: CheR family methyltransferase, partial [Thermoguttaceae bacterium]